MFLNSIAHYLPSIEITNDYFLDKNGLTDEWIFTRTGIKSRQKAEPHENTNTMGIDAVNNLLAENPKALEGVDLIIGGSYTPYDTVGTLAHQVQQHFNIANARAVYISSACSSLINGLEIVEGYFATNKAKKALIVVSEYNSGYSDDADDMSGHLWGDGAAAMIVTKERSSNDEFEFIELITEGLAHVGKGPGGVFLRPSEPGIQMKFGKDVFLNACNIMTKITNQILENNGYSIGDLDYLVPHQANVRIINNVVDQLGINKDNCIVNVNYLGNTGCASTGIGLSENWDKINNTKLCCLTVFGGGYSSGAALLKK